MIYISHRGNIDGVNQNIENSMSQIDHCIDNNFHVEVDVWKIDNIYWLGHDKPLFMVNLNFFINRKDFLWCHAKNVHALSGLIDHDIHCFWHQKDDYTLTSKGILWGYVGQPIHERVVCVLPELCNYAWHNSKLPYAICSDRIKYYKEIIGK